MWKKERGIGKEELTEKKSTNERMDQREGEGFDAPQN